MPTDIIVVEGQSAGRSVSKSRPITEYAPTSSVPITQASVVKECRSVAMPCRPAGAGPHTYILNIQIYILGQWRCEVCGAGDKVISRRILSWGKVRFPTRRRLKYIINKKARLGGRGPIARKQSAIPMIGGLNPPRRKIVGLITCVARQRAIVS